MTLGTAAYDLAGRLTNSTDALSQPTTYTETRDSAGQLVRTTTFADAGTRIETFAKDGTLLKVSGTAVRPVRHTNWVETSGTDSGKFYTQEIKLDGSGADTGEWTKQYSDAAGRTYKILFSDDAYSHSFFNLVGQLSKAVDPDGVTILYAYNNLSELNFTALDMNRDGNMDFGGTDRIVQTTNDVLTSHTTTVRLTRQYAWATDASSSATLMSTRETSADGLQTWSDSFGLTNYTRTKFAGGGIRYETNTVPAGTYTVSRFENGRLAAVTQYSSAGTQVGATTYG